MLLAFFLLEYIRPEPFVQLRPQMISIILFPILWLSTRQRPWSRNLTFQASFIGVCALSVVFAWNYFDAYIVTRTMWGHVTIALAITWLLANRRDFVLASWFWVVIMAFQALFGVTHGGHGMGSVLGDENDLALGLNTALPFAVVGMRTFRDRRRWACAALVVLFLAGIVASNSRGGFIGLVAVILYCVLVGRNRMRNLLVGLVGALVFYLAIPQSYKKELESIEATDEGTSEVRLFFWLAAFNMWSHNPVLGVGAGNSTWNLGRYQPPGRASGLFSGPQFHERNFTTQAVHSAFFQVLSETGTVGTGLFAAVVVGHFTGLRALRRRVKRDTRASPGLRKETELYAVALGAAMMGYLGSGAFLSVAYYPYPWYFSAFATALIRAVNAQLSPSHPGANPGARSNEAQPEPGNRRFGKNAVPLRSAFRR